MTALSPRGPRTAPARRRAAATVATVALTAGLLAGCTGPATHTGTRPSPAPLPSTAATAATTSSPSDGGELPADGGRWVEVRVGQVVLPGPMRPLLQETYGPVTAAAFNAGRQAPGIRVVTWVRQHNPGLQWTTDRSGNAWHLTGTGAGLRNPVTMDLVNGPAGLLIRVLDPTSGDQTTHP